MDYLIVEDNPNIRTILRQLLCSSNDIVAECATGEEALEVYRRVKPHIVIMDIQLPGKDGIAATREIKRDFPDACIIVVSDYDTPSFRAATSAIGAAGFVPKERLPELREIVRSVTQRVPRRTAGS